MTYIGAENIISPLGSTAEQNFEEIRKGHSGIRIHSSIGLKGEDLPVSVMTTLETFDPIEIAVRSIQAATKKLNSQEFEKHKKCLLISTTKGDLKQLQQDVSEASLLRFKQQIHSRFPEFDDIQLISNACISGVLSLVWANDLVQSEQFDSVVVCGVDMLSTFTLAGFQSFFALSDTHCRPFDKDRTGINLGEAASTIVVSSQPSLFKEACFHCLGGSVSSDANHISGPSRTGEGLFRTIDRTIRQAKVEKSEIDFISAHGTGTNYNDEMESIAFDRHELNKVPLNSLKGYFGHTFGAAGLVESSICLQSMRKNVLIASAGYANQGTTKEINVLQENQSVPVDLILKTASGFGGSNASILFKK